MFGWPWFKKKKKVVAPEVKPQGATLPNQEEKLPAHYLKALNEVGVREIAGNAHNPRILEYHKASKGNFKTDEISWCASFVNWCFEQAGHKGTGLANARSFLNWGTPVTDPQRGDVVVFWRNKKDSWEGHVAFFVSFDGEYVNTFGGNQGNEVCFSRYKKDTVLGYRRLIANA